MFDHEAELRVANFAESAFRIAKAQHRGDSGSLATERTKPFAISPAVLTLRSSTVFTVAAVASVGQSPFAMPVLINVVAQWVPPFSLNSNHPSIHVSKESYPRDYKLSQVSIVGDK